MAPDYDKIISLKIITAEKAPSHWQKDLVWSRIQSTMGRRQPLKFYYAAALILAVSFLTVYNYYRWEQQRVNLRISWLEESIDQVVKQKSATVNMAAPQENCISGNSTDILHPMKKGNIETDFTVPDLIDVPVVTELAEESIEITSTPIMTISAPTVQPDTVPQRVVEAIIGTIPIAHSDTRTARLKKVKFKLLRGNEFPDGNKNPESSSHVITARIN